MRSATIAVAAAAALAACDAGEGMDPVVDSEGFEVLVDLQWEVPPGGSEYFCARQTIDDGMYIGSFESLAPPGTHHTVLTSGPAAGPDGFFECGSFTHNFNQFLFESSSGSDRFDMPDGLAAYVEPGHQLNVNVHVVNAGDTTLTGSTGTRIARRAESEVEEIATSLYMGNTNLDLPLGESSVEGTCQLDHDVEIFGALPHMHGWGKHMKVVAKSSIAGDVVVHDEDYDYDSTKNYHPIDPVAMKAGDTVEVTCTYDNESGMELHWGLDSYTAEMCFAAMYLYPAEGIAANDCLPQPDL